MWEANPKQPTIQCEAANSLLCTPREALGPGISGGSTNVEIHLSPEVACEEYARVANWDEVFIKQHWLSERKNTVPSKQTVGEHPEPAVPTMITAALEIGRRAIGVGLSSGHLRIALATPRHTTGQVAELVETQCC